MDFDGLTSIPSDQSNIIAGGYIEEDVHMAFSVEETLSIERFVQENKVTVNVLLHAAWSIILSKYIGKNDLAFGFVVSGRPAELKGVEQMVGLFINTLVQRINLEQDESIGSFLSRLMADLAEMQEHAYLPVAEVQSASGLGGKLRVYCGAPNGRWGRCLHGNPAGRYAERTFAARQCC
jgi:hypothetical protein